MATTLLVTICPSHPLAWHAYRYAKACLNKDPASSLSVFFYGDGANTANALRWQSAEQQQVSAAWQDLGKRYPLRLLVCVSTALARGVSDADNSKRHGLDGSNTLPAFELVGLGEFVDMLKQQTTTLQF